MILNLAKETNDWPNLRMKKTSFSKQIEEKPVDSWDACYVP
jgi:hypothetical protein